MSVGENQGMTEQTLFLDFLLTEQLAMSSRANKNQTIGRRGAETQRHRGKVKETAEKSEF